MYHRNLVMQWRLSLAFLLFTAVFYGKLAAIEVEGTVTDSIGKPLVSVSIVSQKTEAGSISDEFGRFRFRDLAVGDTLVFSHISYVTVKHVIKLGNVSLHVIMKPAVIGLDPVTKLEDRPPVLSEPHFTVDLSSEKRAQTVTELYSELPGVFVRSYGGRNAAVTISADGGASSGTQVYIDEIPQNSPQNGSADLSLLPGALMNSLSIANAGIGEQGTGAVDAVIRLDPWAGTSFASLMAGSFGFRQIDGLYSMPNGSFIAGLGYSENRGDFPYEWDGKTNYRTNNDSRFSYALIGASTDPLPGAEIRFLFYTVDHDRGTPGLMWFPEDTLGRRTGREVGSILKFDRSGDDRHTSASLSANISDGTFVNPLIGADAENSSGLLQFRTEHTRTLNGGILWLQSLTWRRENIDSNTAGTADRYMLSIQQGLRLMIADWSVKPALSWHHLKGGDDRSLLSLTAENSGQLPFPWKFTANVGQTFRYPSFNELYWQPGGNPDLKTEETRSAFIRLEMAIAGDILTQQELFIKQSESLIQWIPQQQYWRPVNIDETMRSGWKGSLAYHGRLLDLLRVYGSIFYARDISNGVRNLRFVPDYLYGLEIRKIFGSFQVAATADGTGPYAVFYSSPDDVVIPGKCLGGLEVSWHNTLTHNDIGVIFKVDNVGDLKYESIIGYPETGRNYTVSLIIEPQK